MEKESKEQKIWVDASETINTGEYENIKVNAGFSQIYKESDDPLELIEKGITEVTKIIQKKSKKIRRKL